MSSDGDATVNPSQPWTENGTADVAPILPLSGSLRTLPLENRDPGPATIDVNEYPLGLVVIPAGAGPSTTPATLPVYVAPGSSYQIANEDWHECPDGFVIWFSGR